MTVDAASVIVGVVIMAAIDELRLCAGRHFEPRIVDVLVAVVGNGHAA